MKYSKLGAATIAATAVTLTLSMAGCSSDDKDSSSSKTSAASTSAAASSAKTSSSGAPKSKLSPRTTENTAGPNYTIADYIKDQKITETPIHPDDAGAPTIELPLPDGWETAGDKTPDWAYGAIIYTGPEAASADYPPNFIAILSKLEGDVDPQKLIDNAGGEIKNLPEVELLGEGEVSTLDSYPAYQIAASYTLEGQKVVTAQKTVVIPGADGLYILQLNGTSNEAQGDILQAAAQTIDEKTTITP